MMSNQTNKGDFISKQVLVEINSFSIPLKSIIIQAYISKIDVLSNTIRETSELETLAQTI